MSANDRSSGKSLLRSSSQGPPDPTAIEPDERQRQALWLRAITCLLLIGVGLVLTSPPGDFVGPVRDSKARKSPRRSPPQEPAEPIAVVETDEPNREPLWLLAFAFLVVIGVGMLLIFYTDLPVSALI